jgi:hypothetical protein
VILQERGDWSYAALPNGQRGWISTKAVEKVRLWHGLQGAAL